MLPRPPRSTLFPYTTLFRSSRRHLAEKAARLATKFLRAPTPPRSRPARQKTKPRARVSSFHAHYRLRRQVTFQRCGQFRRMPGDFDAVEIARARQVHFKDLSNTPRRGCHNHNPIGEACRFTHIVRDKDDCLAALLPNLLDVAVKLFACHGIER